MATEEDILAKRDSIAGLRDEIAEVRLADSERMANEERGMAMAKLTVQERSLQEELASLRASISPAPAEPATPPVAAPPAEPVVASAPVGATPASKNKE